MPIAAILSAITALPSVVSSVETLVQYIVTEIGGAHAAGDVDKVGMIVSDLATNASAIAQAVAANTDSVQYPTSVPGPHQAPPPAEAPAPEPEAEHAN